LAKLPESATPADVSAAINAAIDTALSGVNTQVTGLTGVIGGPAVLDNPNTPENEARPATGIFKLLEDAESAGVDRDEAIRAIIGSPGTADTPATGLYSDLAGLGLSVGELETALGAPGAEGGAGTGLYGELETGLAGLRTDIGRQLDELEERRKADAEAARQAAAAQARQAEINARIRAEQQRLSAARQQFFGMLQQPDALGRKVEVKTPEVAKLGPLYTGLYDPAQGLFKTPEQQQFFESPFGMYFDGGEVTEEELSQIVRG
jgi:hypothetical protein